MRGWDSLVAALVRGLADTEVLVNWLAIGIAAVVFGIAVAVAWVYNKMNDKGIA